MAEVIFNYQEDQTKVQCNINDKMSDIINKFLIKTKKNEEAPDLYYSHNGTNINEELSFYEQANKLDKERKKMIIIIIDSNEDQNKDTEILSKDIICPTCKEIILLNIDNFKINLSGCKKNHDIKDIKLNDFEKTQKIDISKIICEICNRVDKSKSHKNIFYICNTCNKNICPYVNINMMKTMLLLIMMIKIIYV